jgi:uncharacterized protein YndB with AHSA1/START domain
LNILWPKRFDPSLAPKGALVHACNEVVVSASPELIWAWLIRAPLWPCWYPNSKNVRIREGVSTIDLGLHSRFTWKTFNVPLHSEVVEFEPLERIAWSGLGIGVDVHHAWLIEPVSSGTRVLTEETQYGWLARLGHWALPQNMHEKHQMWLVQLGHMAQGGPPPIPKEPS